MAWGYRVGDLIADHQLVAPSWCLGALFLPVYGPSPAPCSCPLLPAGCHTGENWNNKDMGCLDYGNPDNRDISSDSDDGDVDDYGT